MANIITIETSGRICSVALAANGECIAIKEFTPDNGAQMEHSAMLAPFIDELLRSVNWNFNDNVDAIAVSAGPGSYTGLRIGLATAKGLCFGGGKKLITIDSLCSIVEVALSHNTFDADTILCPMIDARRMEIYCAMYSNIGERLTDIAPIVVDDNTFAQYASRRVVVFGSGAQKCLDALGAAGVDATFIDIELSASGLCGVAQTMFDNGQFADVAYCEPLYLKEFVGTKPKLQ